MRTVPDALRSVARYFAEVLGPDWEVRFTVEEGTFRRPFCRVYLAGNTPMTGSAHTVETSAPMNVKLWAPIGDTPEESMFFSLAAEEKLIDAIRLRGGGHLLTPTSLVAAVASSGTMLAATYSYRVTARARRGETAASTAVTVPVGNGGSVGLAWNEVHGAHGYRVYRDGLLIANTQAAAWVDTGYALQSAKVAPVLDSTVVGAAMRIPLYQYDGVALDAPASVRGSAEYLRVADFALSRQVDNEDERLIVTNCDLRVAWRRAATLPEADRTLLDVRLTGVPAP